MNTSHTLGAMLGIKGKPLADRWFHVRRAAPIADLSGIDLLIVQRVRAITGGASGASVVAALARAGHSRVATARAIHGLLARNILRRSS